MTQPNYLPNLLTTRNAVSPKQGHRQQNVKVPLLTREPVVGETCLASVTWW